MEITATQNTAVVEEQQVSEKLHVSGEDKRRLLILMQDWEARYRDFAQEGNLDEYFAKYGRYQAMYKGLIPVEELPQIKYIPLNEKRIEAKDPLMCVDFYSEHPDTRFVKDSLKKIFRLVHFPQAQTKPATGRPDYLEGHKGARRFKVWNVTNEAATIAFNRYKDELQLYFVDIYFWKDRTEEMPIAPVTLPQSKAQEVPQILNIDDLIEEE